MSVMSAATGALGGGSGYTVGTAAAWALTFHGDDGTTLTDLGVTVDSDTYDGTINATLPEGLAGGSYEVVVEGMTDDDYAKVRLTAGHKVAARLYLWWKDSPGLLGDLASFTGLSSLGALTPAPPATALVAELRVDRVSRRAGERRYEAVFTLRERAFARLHDLRVDGRCYDDLPTAFSSMARAAGITITPHGLTAITPGPDDPTFAAVAPGRADESLGADHGLLSQVRDGLQLYGAPVSLIRDGVLHVGRWTVPALPVHTIDEDSGLLSVQAGADRDRDAMAGDATAGAAAARPTVTVVAMGRPDVKPGDTVQVVLPPQDYPTASPGGIGASVLTSLTGLAASAFGVDDDGPPSSCLVKTVSHTLSRRGGFATRLTAVVLASASDDGWDAVPAGGLPTRPTSPARERGTTASDTAHATAGVIRSVAERSNRAAGSRVGQVRTHPASTQTGQTPPRHTSAVWYADVSGDGLPAATQRAQITEAQHGEAREVPYLTSFAWGHYGVVLPRYPGTRVLLSPTGGNPGDLVDIGAVWQRDGGPPAQAGDYWMVLPIGVNPRDDIGESDGSAPDGAASHDLIDGDGTRLIETKRFVVRVTDSSTECTTRPTPGGDAPDGSLVVENVSGGNTAQIVMKSDGSITIKATSLTFDCGTSGAISFKGGSVSIDTAGNGNIALKANDVTVSVSGTMDVS